MNEVEQRRIDEFQNTDVLLPFRFLIKSINEQLTKLYQLQNRRIETICRHIRVFSVVSSEDEVLFALGSHFQLVKIHYDEENEIHTYYHLILIAYKGLFISRTKLCSNRVPM